MVRSRRSIHSKNDAIDYQHREDAEEEDNEKDLPKYNRHGKLKYDEDNTEDKTDKISSKKEELQESSSLNKTDGKIPANQKNLNEGLNYNKYLVSVMVLLLVILSVYLYINHGDKSFEVRVYNQTPDEIKLDDELYGLEDIYKQQEDRVWFTFAAGIKAVIAENPHKPSVFLMLYDNEQTEKTVKCLTQDVTRAASKYLMKRETKPLMFAGAQLNEKRILEDPGLLLVHLKEPVEKSGSLIVTNLEDVNPKIATSFHFFCDRYSPLVEKAIFFFTLKLKNKIPKVPLHKVAEDALADLWINDLPENKLYPLITRLTGNVIQIVNDYNNC